MSFGAMIGGTLVDKGIDQFSWGVGQEYRRHERHRLRADQEADYQMQRGWDIEDQQNKWKREFKQKMAMADRFGIHPLALLGTGGSSASGGIVSSPRSAPPVNTPSGGFRGNIHTAEEKRIMRANARKAEAEADLLEGQVKNQMGQSPSGMSYGTASLESSQPDGDIYPIGIDPNVDNAQKSSVDRTGNVYVQPKDNEAFSDEAPPVNRVLYTWRDIKYPFNVKKLKNNWTDPKLNEFKYRFLKARPKPRNNKEVVLWNGTNWQAFRKTKQNQSKIFVKGYPTIKPYKFKKKRGRIIRDRIIKKATQPGYFFHKGSPNT